MCSPGATSSGTVGSRSASAKPTVSHRACRRTPSGSAPGHAATHVHLLPHDDEAARQVIVRDLIARWHPPCNQTLVDTLALRDHVVMSG